jgi:hypothetical protein
VAAAVSTGGGVIATPTLKFSEVDAEAAWTAWTFNCGPASVCAVTGLTPDGLRPHVGDFEQKGYTNPTLMYAILNSLGVTWKANVNPREPGVCEWPRFGLARIQWAGPWTGGGVPMAARYRQTHWVASWREGSFAAIFDVNAMASGGWVQSADWAKILVPWILKEGYPRASGEWWITNALELPRGADGYALRTFSDPWTDKERTGR